jgi:hypothetical protein
MATSARTDFFSLTRWIALLVALLPAAARGAPPPDAPVVQIIELYEPDVDPRAQALTNALRDVIFDAGDFQLNTRGHLLMQVAAEAKCDTKPFGIELLEASDKGMSRACLERLGKRIGAKAFFWGFLFKGEGGRGMVKAHLWQGGQDRVVALPYDPDRRRLAERLYRHLTQPGKVGDVRLLAAVGAPTLRGELWVNDRAQGPWEATGVALTVPAGELVAEVRSGEKVLARGRGTVAASGTSAVSLEPVAEPPPTPPPVTQPPRQPVTPPIEPSGESGGWAKPLGWAALGTGVVALGFGLVANGRVSSLDDELQSNESFASYRLGIVRGQGVCSAAEQGAVSSALGAATPDAVGDHCGSIDTWKTVRAVSYLGGGVLVTGGAALLLFGPSRAGATEARAKRPTLNAAPLFGPGFAGASFRAAW